jgi:hypothetical protein
VIHYYENKRMKDERFAVASAAIAAAQHNKDRKPYVTRPRS